jgi:hypothetical protein
MNNLLSRLPSLTTILWILASLVAFGAFLFIAPNLLNPPQPTTTPTPVSFVPGTVAATATLPLTETPAPIAPPPKSNTNVPAPTPPPDARIFTSIADPTLSGYIKTNDEGIHWGDRNLHSGYFGNDRYWSILVFDISELPPNSEILSAHFEATGLSRDNLGAQGEWRAGLLRLKPFEDWNDLKPADFLNATVTSSVGTPLGPSDLDLGRENEFIFAPDQIPALENEVGQRTFLVFRIDGPTGPNNSLFTWDGGGLNLESGSHPTLRIVARPGEFVVVTNTPFPENVVTAAAIAVQQTDFATRFGTVTPFPRSHATGTPIIYVTREATPENVLTRVAIAQIATAIAFTTGTYTPTPENWVEITATFTPVPTRTPLVIPVSTLYARLTPTALPTRTPSIPEILRTPIPDFLKGNLLILTDRFINLEIAVMRPDGTLIQGLTGGDLYDLAFTREPFSPDRRRRAIVAADDSGVLQIWIEDQTNGQRTLVTRIARGIAYDPVWSPDGSRIAYVSRETGNDEIYIYDIGSEISTRITRGGNPFIYKQKPTWSPDGTEIAFKANDGTLNFQIWIMSADGNNLRNISKSTSNDSDPIWVK